MRELSSLDTLLPRQARRASVPADTVVFAVGDIHGCADRLINLHCEIRRSAAMIAAARRVVIYIGDYVDRGPDSRRVIDTLLDDPLPNFESVFLLGNHEILMRAFRDGDSAAAPWVFGWRCGGVAVARRIKSAGGTGKPVARPRMVHVPARRIIA